MENDLTPEERKMIKEFAQNYAAFGRVGRLFRTGLIWVASAVAAWFLIVDNILKLWGRH